MRSSGALNFLFLATCLFALVIDAFSTAAAMGSSLLLAPLTLVSAGSPFAACAFGGAGTAYLNSRAQPSLAANPKNAQNLIGAWQQDTWSNGGARGLVAGYTLNGGKSWGQTPLPLSACAPGGLDYERASSPWISIGPDGVAYAVSISFNTSNDDNAAAAVTSADGGKTWGRPHIFIADGGTALVFNDMISVTADPLKAGTAYSVWSRLQSPRANPYSDPRTLASSGSTWFSMTTDGGKTWAQSRIIVAPNPDSQTNGNQIVVDPRNGTLYLFFDLITLENAGGQDKSPSHAVAFVKSTDGGVGWSAPVTITPITSVGVTHPNTGAPVRTGEAAPRPAIDATSGRLYVVWQDARFSRGRYDEVALSTSADGGATWSAPIRVNTPVGRPAFSPSVQVAASGTLGITYADFRTIHASNTTTLPTDYWLALSTNHGAGFGTVVHLSGPFDLMLAPHLGGYPAGDHQALVATSSGWVPFFVQTSAGHANRTDLYVVTLTP